MSRHELELKGVLVPALTPFEQDQRPNVGAFVKHCRWLLQQGADGLAVFGTTSEANSLSCDERIVLLEVLIDSGVPASRIMPGTGTCALTDSVRLTRHAVEHACAGVLMLPPFYYKGVSDEGLFAAYSHVIEQVGDDRLRIYLYHIPPMSQIGLSPALIGRLIKDYPSVVVGLKDSGGDWAHTAFLLKEFPQLSIFPGSESFLLAGLRHGSAGCITATGNINPAGIRRVFERRQEQDADELQAQITRIRKVIQSYAMIPALKTMVADHYQDPDWLRLRPPLVPLDKATQNKLLTELDELGFNMADNGKVVNVA